MAGGPHISGQGYTIEETTDVGASGTPLSITIENTGEGTLDISQIAMSGTTAQHFEVDTMGTDFAVASMQSTTLTLSFTPQNGGRKVGTLNILSDDADEATYTVLVAAGSTSNRWRSLGEADGPVARYDAAIAEIDSSAVLLFGGRTAEGTVLGDAWIYTVEADTWTEVDLPTMPSARFSHGLVSVGDRQVLLFGGVPSEGGMALGDTWIYDALAQTWTDQGPSTVPARFEHGLVGLSDTAILFGGLDDTGPADTDLWIFDVPTATWSSLATTGAVTSVASAGVGYRSGAVSVAGGVDVDGPREEGFDIAALSGNGVAHSSTLGAARAELQLVYLSANIAIGFGGRSTVDGVAADTTYQYLFTPRTWSDLAPPSAPPARHSYAATAVGSSRKMLVFGGRAGGDGSTVHGDLWEYVGSYD